jgi:hypothetical protein
MRTYILCLLIAICVAVNHSLIAEQISAAASLVPKGSTAPVSWDSPATDSSESSASFFEWFLAMVGI